MARAQARRLSQRETEREVVEGTWRIWGFGGPGAGFQRREGRSLGRKARPGQEASLGRAVLEATGEQRGTAPQG